MNRSRFRASTGTMGGTPFFLKSILSSLVLALIVASFAVAGAFAAPEKVSGSQLRELGAALRWYNNYHSQPGSFRNAADQAKVQQYLGQYAFALGQAQAIVANGGTNSNSQNSNSSANNTNGQGNGNGSSQFNNSRSAEQQLGAYLHMMRGLQDKIMSVSGSGNGQNNNNSNSSASNTGNNSNGIPVTGGSSSSTSSNNSGNNSSQNNSNNNSNNNGNNNSSSQLSGSQLRDLGSAMRWYNNFKTQPGKMGLGRQAQIQQYLDQYASALRQAQRLLINGSNNNNGQNNSSGGQGNGTSPFNNNQSHQQQMAMYLHIMRGLRDKIMIGRD